MKHKHGSAHMRNQVMAARQAQEARKNAAAVRRLPSSECEVIIFGERLWLRPDNATYDFDQLRAAVWYFRDLNTWLTGSHDGRKRTAARAIWSSGSATAAGRTGRVARPISTPASPPRVRRSTGRCMTSAARSRPRCTSASACSLILSRRPWGTSAFSRPVSPRFTTRRCISMSAAGRWGNGPNISRRWSAAGRPRVGW
jgi:hypothetical protein